LNASGWLSVCASLLLLFLVLLLRQVLVLLSEEVVDKCVAVVRQLKGITATYRMTSKGPPVRHSHYVTGERMCWLLSMTHHAYPAQSGEMCCNPLR
jgi:hypothetical protein